MITEEQFLRYEEVRASGVTNMIDIVRVGVLSDLNRKQCLEIMSSYSNLKDKYLTKESK
ncbi:unnamed protein product [marine sediment metagenome]|uniref:Uncharacterized protein n=1 Tax=marine sediment metagenome TaxID=412755 RepID=X0VKK0_9ZZZZ